MRNTQSLPHSHRIMANVLLAFWVETYFVHSVSYLRLRDSILDFGEEE